MLTDEDNEPLPFRDEDKAGNIVLNVQCLPKVPALITVWSPDPYVESKLAEQVRNATLRNPAYEPAVSAVDLQVVRMKTPTALDVMKKLVKGDYFFYNENFISAYPDKEQPAIRELWKQSKK